MNKNDWTGSDSETPTKRYKARDGKFYNGYCGSPDWAYDLKEKDITEDLSFSIPPETKETENE